MSQLRRTGKTGSGWRGTSPGSTGARTGAIHSTFRRTLPGCTTRATSAWPSTIAAGCELRRRAWRRRCLIQDRATTSMSTRSSQLTARVGSGRSSVIGARCSTTSTGGPLRTTLCGRSTPATTRADPGRRCCCCPIPRAARTWQSRSRPTLPGASSRPIPQTGAASATSSTSCPTYSRRAFRCFPAKPSRNACLLSPCRRWRQRGSPPTVARERWRSTSRFTRTTSGTWPASATMSTKLEASATRSTGVTCTATRRSPGTATTTALPRTPIGTRSTPAP